jgi:fatty-acyl-CoA synthase
MVSKSTNFELPGEDGCTLPAALARAVLRYGDKEAVVFTRAGYRRRYTEFLADVNAAAKGFIALGIRTGEHVGVWATNQPEWLICQFALASIGAVQVNINPAYRPRELAYAVSHVDLVALVVAPKLQNTPTLPMLLEICPELETSIPGQLASSGLPALRWVISTQASTGPGLLAWDELLARGAGVAQSAVDERTEKITVHDVANIQFTSGTTGHPKAALLTHKNLTLNAYYVGMALQLTEKDRLCIPVPFYHCFGCVIGTLMCIIHGTTMVIPNETYDAEATLQAVHDERCTALHGVPTMFIAELNHPRFGDFDLTSLRTGIMAGSPCPVEIMRQVVQRMGMWEVTISYGQTETSPVITSTTCTDSLEHRCTTIGKPLPGIEVKIVHPESREELPPGLPGELLCRGHNVMKGYYKREEATVAAITPDGWLKTGDLACKVADGYYKITGRLKDMIIRGGENIFPREIEELLLGHPAVQDIQVVGLPDAKMGEEVSAWITLRRGASLNAEAVQAYCRERVARYKVPRYVVFVDEFPTTVTGKIQKFKLRDMGIARFGLEEAARIQTC